MFRGRAQFLLEMPESVSPEAQDGQPEDDAKKEEPQKKKIKIDPDPVQCGVEVLCTDFDGRRDSELQGKVVALQDGWVQVQCVDQKWGLPLGTHWFMRDTVSVVPEEVD